MYVGNKRNELERFNNRSFFVKKFLNLHTKNRPKIKGFRHFFDLRFPI